MSTKQRELLRSQTNAEEPTNLNSSEELLEQNPIENTPFILVGNKEKGYFVAIGHYRLTPRTTKEQALGLVEERDWNLLMAAMFTAVEVEKQVPPPWKYPKQQPIEGNYPVQQDNLEVKEKISAKINPPH